MPATYDTGEAKGDFVWSFASAEQYTCTESDVSGNAALSGYKLVYTDENANFDYEIYALSTDDIAGPFQFSEKLVNKNELRTTITLSDFFDASVDGKDTPRA